MHLNDLYRQTQAASGNPHIESWRAAARDDVGGFERWLCSVPFSQCSLFEIYEALATDSEPPVQLLIREFDRLLAAAESEPKNPEIPAQLAAFCFLDNAAEFRDHAVAALSMKLGATAPQVRRLACSMLAYFATSADQTVLGQLRTHAKQDNDWRVRHQANHALGSLHLDDSNVTAPEKMALADRVRVAILGRSSADNISA